MSISEKIKAINNKIEQNKAWYNLNRQTAKISALSSGNVSKYEFLTDKDVLPGKGLARKSFNNENIWIFSVSKDLKTQTGTAKKQYEKLDDT